MSQIRSTSLARRYGMARVARVWKFSRASIYRSRKEMSPNTSGRRPGPGGACSDAELAGHIRQHIAASRLHGEGYRKLVVGIHASRSANRFEALEPVRQGVHAASEPSRPEWPGSCVTIMAPTTCPAISKTKSNAWESKLRPRSCESPRATASQSASSEP